MAKQRGDAVQCQARQKGNIICTLGNSASMMQSNLQGCKKPEFIPGDPFSPIKYRFAANEKVLFVVCALEGPLAIETGQIVDVSGGVSSHCRKLFRGLGKPVE